GLEDPGMEQARLAPVEPPTDDAPHGHNAEERPLLGELRKQAEQALDARLEHGSDLRRCAARGHALQEGVHVGHNHSAYVLLLELFACLCRALRELVPAPHALDGSAPL